MADTVIATQSRHPRAIPPEAVADEFTRRGQAPEIVGDVAQALTRALEIAERRDIICATGSLFLVGEVMESVRGLRPEHYPR